MNFAQRIPAFAKVKLDSKFQLTGEPTFPSQAWEYIYRLIFLSSIQGKEFKHLDAKTLLEIFRNRTTLDFGDQKKWVLENWNLHHSRDLGSLIFLLAESGCIHLQDEDQKEDYENAGPL